MKGRLLFQEQQAFKNLWAFDLTMVLLTSKLTLIFYGFYQQIIIGEPWGGHRVSDTGLMLLVVGAVVLTGGLLWFFQILELNVKIDQGGVKYSFVPFDRELKTIRREDLKDLEYVKGYSQSGYGGYGYHISRKLGKTYRFRGKSGVQLIFKNGKRLFLGTQKPGELEAAIKTLKKNWEMR